MAFSTDDNGNITLVQGDSGTLVVSGLNTDADYTVYLAIQDENRNSVTGEISVNSNKSSEVIFELSGEFTDMLTVKKNKLFEIYYYGIKVCDSDTALEDTLVIGGGSIGDRNMIIVYPKKAEGI